MLAAERFGALCLTARVRIQDNPALRLFISPGPDLRLLKMDSSKAARSLDPETYAVGTLRGMGD